MLVNIIVLNEYYSVICDYFKCTIYLMPYNEYI